MFSFNRTTNRTRGGISAMIALTAIMAVGGFAGTAKADLVAYWNFNGEAVGTITAPLQANVGSGQIDTSGWGGSAAIASGFFGGGTTQNALFGDPAGNSLRLSPGVSPFPGNLTHIDFQFSMAGRQDLSMSFALRPEESGNDHTFDFHAWSWSTDGVNFTDAIGYEITQFGNAIFWKIKNLDFGTIAELNGAEDVTLRLTLGGANAAHFTSFDNIQIHANVIPAPGAIALLGLAGLFSGGRRRKNV